MFRRVARRASSFFEWWTKGDGKEWNDLGRAEVAARCYYVGLLDQDGCMMMKGGCAWRVRLARCVAIALGGIQIIEGRKLSLPGLVMGQ